MKYYRTNELYHHGILGMKWGKQNGPPYPLKPSDHSASEKKAGWRKSLNKTSDVDGNANKSYTRKGLSDKQKKLIKIGAAVVVTGLVAYGGYKLYKNGAFDSLAFVGKRYTDMLSGHFPEGMDSWGQTEENYSSKSIEHFSSDHIYSGLPKISETVEETFSRVNPYRSSISGSNNCTYCAIAGFLRSEGVDVTAKTTPSNRREIGAGVAENIFKGLGSPENRRRIMDGTATSFGRSREDAERMLKKRYGDNAKGFVNVKFKDGVGYHAFNFEIKNGKVLFTDYQAGRSDWQVSQYWNSIDSSAHFSMIRLDGLIPDISALGEINDIHG